MRQRNWRLIIVGAVLIVLAAMFFVGMQGMAGKSTDPVALMRTVGQVSGVVCGLSLVMIVFGLVGKRT